MQLFAELYSQGCEVTALICKNPAELNFILIVSVNLCLYNTTKEERQSTRRDDHETSIWSIMSSTATSVKGPGELVLNWSDEQQPGTSKIMFHQNQQTQWQQIKSVLIFQEGDHILFWHHYSNFTFSNKAINK